MKPVGVTFYSRRDVSRLAQDGVFWMCLVTHFRATGPLNHHMSFMKNRLKGVALATHGQHLSRLVRGKAFQVYLEFDQLWHADWSEVFDIATGTSESPDQVCALIVQQIAYQTLSYQRRILDYVNQPST